MTYRRLRAFDGGLTDIPLFWRNETVSGLCGAGGLLLLGGSRTVGVVVLLVVGQSGGGCGRGGSDRAIHVKVDLGQLEVLLDVRDQRLLHVSDDLTSDQEGCQELWGVKRESEGIEETKRHWRAFPRGVYNTSSRIGC